MRTIAFLLLFAPILASAQYKLPDPAGKVECPELLDLKKQSDTVQTANGQWGKILPVLDHQWKRLDELEAADALHTGADFYIAAELAQDPMNFFEHARQAHEMAITSLLLDEPNAPKLVARTWDMLILSTGRLPRLGTTFDFDFEKKGPVPAKLDPDAIPSIGALLRDPEAGRKLAQQSKDNQELLDLRAADQKDREGDMSKPRSLDDDIAFMKRDRDREARVIEILKAGGAKTAKDYEAAGLVLQHSPKFEGYELAHELCLASLALGSKEAAWLVSRTYDRMLLSAGYRQRYGSNMNMAGLMPLAEGINDRMRKLAGVQPIAEMIKQGEEWKRKVAGMTGG